MPVRFPAPYFGKKTAVAGEVWKRFGDVHTYVEPFAGSLAVLLGRPDEHEWWARVETVGDYSSLVANFHRAVAADPEGVAFHASYPVTEADLTARHLALVRAQPQLADGLMSDPDYFDARLAGWWVWGLSAWVGGEWCSGLGGWKPGDPGGPGVYRKMPMVHGIHPGKGVHRKLPPSAGVEVGNVVEVSREHILGQMRRLSDRLRRVRVTCGDWERLTHGAVAAPRGEVAGVFLDPPYDTSMRRANLYGPEDTQVGDGDDAGGDNIRGVWVRAREWALSRTDDHTLRVAYCTYSNPAEDAQFVEAGWSPFRWKASGGYGLQSDREARGNRSREVVWFSPSCMQHTGIPGQETLFDEV